MPAKRLGEMLIGNGIITHDQLEKALEVQDKTGGPLGMILIDLNFITPEILHSFLKAQDKPD